MLDDEIIANQQDLLAAYRQTLAVLVRTAAMNGGESLAPPATANSIIETRANIARIKAELRTSGVIVRDEPNDIAPPPPDPLQGAGHIAEQRTAYTGGGDYAENNIDKRQGAFVKDSTVKGAVVGENKGTININPTANTEQTKDQKEEAELQKYIDFITEQVSSGRLHEEASPNIKNIAISHTRTLLKSINKDRKGRIITFLYDSYLIGWYEENEVKVHPCVISLEKADLSGVDLSGADLSGADLSGAKIDSTTKIGTKSRLIWDIHTNGAPNRDLHGADLSGAVLHGADLSGTVLHGADLSGAVLEEANLHRAVLEEANLHRANLHGAFLGRVNLHGAFLPDTNLHEAVLFNADLSGADLSGADLSGAVLGGANLHGVNLYGVNHHGAMWDTTTKWPEGFTPPVDAIKTNQPE